MADDLQDSDGYGVTGQIPPELQNDSLSFHEKGDGWEADIDLGKLMFTRKEKAQMTEKMVKPMQEALYDATPYDANDPGFKNGSSTKKLFGKNVKHLREGITHHPNQFADGSTQLGFKRGYYPVAFWTDRGTINQPGTGWFERFSAHVPADEAFNAAYQEAKLIWGSKHGSE